MKKLVLLCTILIITVTPLLTFSGCPSPEPTTPLTAKEYYDMGCDYHNQGQLDQAITAYSNAIILDPNYVYAYNNRGVAYSDKGLNDQAIMDYNKAIEIDPTYALAYSNRGIAYKEKGQYDLAIADYSKALEFDSTNFRLYSDRGVAYYKLGQYDKSIADYNRSLELDPENSITYANRATSYYAMGQYELAIADFYRAIEIASDSDAVQYATETLDEMGQPAVETETDILQGARWTLDHGDITEIAWINKDGEEVRSWAVSGEAQIIADPAVMSPEAVDSLVYENGGTLYAVLPAVGLYWVKVESGQEAAFIENVRASVNDVLPNLMMETRGSPLPLNYTNVTDQNPLFQVTTGNLVLDNFSIPKPWGSDGKGNPVYIVKNSSGTLSVNTDGSFNEMINPPLIDLKDRNGNPVYDKQGNKIQIPDPQKVATHGDVVDYYRTNKNGLSLGTQNSMDIWMKAPVSIQGELGGDIGPASDDVLGLAALIQGANAKGFKPVINVSWGPPEYSNNTKKVNYHPGSEGYNNSNNGGYLDSMSNVLNSNVSGAKDATIVWAAGNGGTDLSRMLVNRLSMNPGLLNQVIMVGALDATGNIASYSNFSTAPDTMIYVPVTGKTKSGINIAGTSFAAPQIQYLVNQILQERPHLTPAQLRQILLDSSVAGIKSIQRPDAPIGEMVNVRVIDNPYDKNLLIKALAAADKQFPKPDYTVTAVSFSPATIRAGQSLSVTFTIKNQGGQGSQSFSNRISLATTLYGTNFSMRNLAMDPLPAGGSRTITVTTQALSAAVPEGKYWVTVFTDGFQKIAESEENNNIGSSNPAMVVVTKATTIPPTTEPEITTQPPGPTTEITTNPVKICTPGSALCQATCIGKSGLQMAPGGCYCDCNDKRNKTSDFGF